MSNDSAPQNNDQKPKSSEQIRREYPPFLVEKMTPEQIMQLPPEVLVDILGARKADGDCPIHTLNTAKKIESDAVIGQLMPQLIVPAQNGQPAMWNPLVDVDHNGVDHHELVAALVRASQIAKEKGIQLTDVKIEDLDCKQLTPIGQDLIGKSGPQVC